ncbi:hypothetical protein J5069_15980 [Candidatus Symbiopectobacterium sp. NZEC127]|uniref:hypothetical protein n=1 Tax=Candidatus Symbiopectobacterium sp. NZEC127 TaxID=2820472 RepID=UPI002226FF38|nr:hypothetical protein [Candidatus Symbiopectobacterium sp. NZEC127]MCW2487398.1 hypothetical protein [Candidatus Symbiopectobacterium sp. NZEC127]
MISRTQPEGINTVSNHVPGPDNDGFDALVLHYLSVNHPQGNLQSILEKLKALAPNSPLTLMALSRAVNVANAKMRKDPAHAQYANTILYKRAMQLTGTNILYTTMMNDIFFPTNEENTVLEKF